jgi:DNA invertase Pin-like site-specific DNA recombinase
VSTIEQDPALQLDHLRAAAVDEVFVDKASGTRTDRPELEKCLKQLREGDTLVVWRLDRLGRSLPHLIETVTGLGERGIGFRSLTEAIDTTTAGGRLLFGIMASIAAFEKDLIRERTMAGLQAARDRGRVGGRPPKVTPEKLEWARSMLAEGSTKTAVARALEISRPTLYDHLERAGVNP